MDKLTVVERQILAGLKDYKKQYGFLPTMRELADFLDRPSFTNIPGYYRSLEEKGYMKRYPGSSPRIEFTNE